MILTTPEELRQYLPTHVVERLDPLFGFIDNSEHDFLLEKVGSPLYKAVSGHYSSIADKGELLAGYEGMSPWNKLVVLCQRPVAFDMLYRAADVSAVSVSESGISLVDTGGYESADKESIERYKRRLGVEAHRGVDRLLCTLEEWAEDVGTVSEGEEPDSILSEKAEIIRLWRESRYYYLVDGLFINTARKFNEYVDIYESREKFIQLLPDLRYCQEFVIRPELGDALMEDLLGKMRGASLSDTEKRAVFLIRYALALKVEERSGLFNRKEAKDEAIGAMQRMLDYLKVHQGDFNKDAVRTAPFYVEPQAEDDVPVPVEEETVEPEWKNNRMGNKLFVVPAIE